MQRSFNPGEGKPAGRNSENIVHIHCASFFLIVSGITQLAAKKICYSRLYAGSCLLFGISYSNAHRKFNSLLVHQWSQFFAPARAPPAPCPRGRCGRSRRRRRSGPNPWNPRPRGAAPSVSPYQIPRAEMGRWPPSRSMSLPSLEFLPESY